MQQYTEPINHLFDNSALWYQKPPHHICLDFNQRIDHAIDVPSMVWPLDRT